MNVVLWHKRQGMPLEGARDLLAESHNTVMVPVEGFLDEGLFHKGRFDWTGTMTLGPYFMNAMSSHYDWAPKKLRAHRRDCKRHE